MKIKLMGLICCSYILVSCATANSTPTYDPNNNIVQQNQAKLDKATTF